MTGCRLVECFGIANPDFFAKSENLRIDRLPIGIPIENDVFGLMFLDVFAILGRQGGCASG